MTLRKSCPTRRYETFPSSNSSEVGQGSSNTSTTNTSNKSGLSVGQEAQRLATQGSWADNVFDSSSNDNFTPSSSTMGQDELVDTRQPMVDDPSDPPPIYRPTDTTVNTIPNSPVAVRSELVGHSHHSRHSSLSPSHVDDQAEESEAVAGACTPSSPLLEQGQRERIPFHDEARRFSRGDCKKGARSSRCKGATWFTLALLACLWLMIPSLMANDGVPLAPNVLC
jgi:hypothetical protein